jgi:hypothetical protein
MFYLLNKKYFCCCCSFNVWLICWICVGRRVRKILESNTDTSATRIQKDIYIFNKQQQQ